MASWNYQLVSNWNVFDNMIGENFSLAVHRGTTERVYECGAKQTLVVRSLLRLVIHSLFVLCGNMGEGERNKEKSEKENIGEKL